MEQVDVVVIGAGVIGAAVAQKLTISGRQVLVLEKHSRIAEGVTSRNSGVVHSGLYYSPNSLKATLCVQGQKLLYEFVEKYGVPHCKTGKFIVASEEGEVEDLESLNENARRCGVTSLEFKTSAHVQKMETNIKCKGALWAPDSGIVDPIEFTKALLHQAEEKGAALSLNTQVLGVSATGRGFTLESERGSIVAEKVVNAAGLDSDKISTLINKDVPRVYPCRGDYFFLRGHHFKHLIYPVKKKGSPGLGIHITLGLDGSVRLGPDAEYVDSKSDFTPREFKADKFRRAVEKYLGPIDPQSIIYDQCGIRPKLRSVQETEEKDFYIKESQPGWVDLIGIESPGLTACLAIAEKVNEIVI